ncbi:hypothetical protein EKO27_g11926 [Xylaria grammica]|uniref:Uncharacterized protein n=1 Tax=Xylaria grammica TaxID=363999 RepID=A0A439CM76_9PEZI|nr:hypothetical protein EKO27_g11926 [Xylaria grammica]
MPAASRQLCLPVLAFVLYIITVILWALASSSTTNITPNYVYVDPQTPSLPRAATDESCYAHTDESKIYADAAPRGDNSGSDGNSDGDSLGGNNNLDGGSNDNSNETEAEAEAETRTRTDNRYIPTDAATRAALLSCCQVHEALRPSASLHDIFDLSPLASCLHENQVRGLSESWHNDHQYVDDDDDDDDDDSDGQPAACYKTLYRRPDLYIGKKTHRPPAQDWDVYIVRTMECVRDMIRWVGNAHDKNDDSDSDSDSDSLTRFHTPRPPPPLSTTRTEQGTNTKEKGKEKEKEGEGEKAQAREEGPNQELLGPLLEAAALLTDNATRSVYGRWIQPHVESANEWAGEQAERCVRTKIGKIRRRRRKAQMQKEEEKGGREDSGSGGGGREAMNGSSNPGWVSSGYAKVRASLGFGGGGEDSARREEEGEEEEEKKEEMRIERLARHRCHAKMYGSRKRAVALWTRFRALPGNVDREAVCDDLAVAMATETAITEGNSD